jgi:hypothetical protein
MDQLKAKLNSLVASGGEMSETEQTYKQIKSFVQF